MRVGVVGAGLGGLSAAAHLVAAGHDVAVYERAGSPGGLAASDVVDGYRLDVGPTVLTMPEVIADAFGALGDDLGRFVKMHRVDPLYRAVFADGSTFRVRSEVDATVEEVRAFAGDREADNFVAFVEWLRTLYRIEMPDFIDADFDSTTDLVRRWRPLLRLVRHAGVRRVDHAVSSFIEDPRLQRVFSFQSLYAGVPPQRAMSLYSVITYLDTVAGVWGVEGGITAVAEALADRLARRGVAFEYDTPVARVVRNHDGAVSALELADDRRVRVDAVVLNTDPMRSYRSLLDIRAPRRLRPAEYSPSCVAWAAGLAAAAPVDAAMHNVHFGWAWDEAFDALGRGVHPHDPSTFVTVTSHGDPTAAPEGGSSILAIELVPNLRGKVDWTSDGARIADALRSRLGRFGYPVDTTVVDRTIDPLGWRTMGLEAGTPFSLAHTVAQTGPLRPRNADPRIPGLAFVGAGTVPGVGVPTVVLSGKLAAHRIDTYAAATRTVRW